MLATKSLYVGTYYTHTGKNLRVIVVEKRGRITLPSEIRRALGIKEGTMLEAAIEGGKIVLRLARRASAKDLLGIAGTERVDLREVEQALGYGRD